MTEPPTGFTFEDRWIPASEGRSLGAALWAAGERNFRHTRGAGAPRALFCGIGNCFECLVDLPDRPATRSCITPVETNVTVRRSPSLATPTPRVPGTLRGSGPIGAVPVQSSAPIPGADPGPTSEHLSVDVAIVGAGPAGLAAALAASREGVSVALIDAAPAPGGNIWRAPRHTPAPNAAPTTDENAWQTSREAQAPGASGVADDDIRPADQHGGTPTGRPATDDDIEPVARYGRGRVGGPPARYRRLPGNVTVLSPTQVVVAEGRGGGGVRLHLDGHPQVAVLDAAAVVLATGATEVVHPFPGWDLPGVITAGAAQALLKGDGVVAGKRVLVAGTGPLLLAVAADLARAGARVVLAEAARPRAQVKVLPAATRHPAKARQALGLAVRLVRHRVRVLAGRRLAAVRAVPESSLLMARLDPERWLAVDAVCVHHGLAPDVALARALGCTTTTDPARGEVAVRVDDHQETDRPGIFAAGEITGVAGAPAAEAEGTVAGLAAALYSRGHASSGRRLGRAQRRAARERGFGEVLGRLWPVPQGWWEHVEAGTTVCRCEEVRWSAMADAVADGAHDLRAVKGRTRAGMGLCQGRVCGPPLQLAVAALSGRPLDPVGDFASRPIAVPVTLARLAELTPASSDPVPGESV